MKRRLACVIERAKSALLAALSIFAVTHQNPFSSGREEPLEAALRMAAASRSCTC